MGFGKNRGKDEKKGQAPPDSPGEEDIWAGAGGEAAWAVSNLIFMKGQMLGKTGLAEIDYEIEVKLPGGTTIKDSGTIRRDAFQSSAPWPKDEG